MKQPKNPAAFWQMIEERCRRAATSEEIDAALFAEPDQTDIPLSMDEINEIVHEVRRQRRQKQT